MKWVVISDIHKYIQSMVTACIGLHVYTRFIQRVDIVNSTMSETHFPD